MAVLVAVIVTCISASLADGAVNQFKNIAVNRPTEQSSLLDYRGYSKNAVDGNRHNVYDNHTSCTHTKNLTTSWWCVDLIFVSNISKVNIYNRNNLKERLQGFTLKTSTNGECNEEGFTSATTCYVDTSSSVEDIYTVDTCNQPSSSLPDTRFIFISVNNKHLTLCEVEVLTDTCPRTTYGGNCTQNCSVNCEGRLCNQTDGNCTSCAAGLSGKSCTKNCNATNCFENKCDRFTGKCNKCPAGKYGDFCVESCSEGCKNSSCNIINGRCTCKTGFQGKKCEECVPGKYSKSCNETCQFAHCINNCNRSTGRCDGCTAGWYGNNCESECSSKCSIGCDKSTGRCDDCKPDTVGDYCNTTCNSGCQTIQNKPTCDRNGSCIHGCIKGKSGDYCNTNCNNNCTVCKQHDINTCDECKDGRWGRSCNQLCNTNCKPAPSTTVGVCNISNGRCDEGCKPGKTGENCSKDCKSGYYGNQCTQTCGRCSANITCDTVSGSCESGCMEGYTGPTCHKLLSSDLHPAIIPGTIGVGVIIIVALLILIIVRSRRNRGAVAVKSNIAEQSVDPVEENEDSTTVNLLSQTDVVYSNVSLPTLINLKDLWTIIQRKKKNEIFLKEYEKLPKDLCHPHDICLSVINKPKNRYKGICAYDHSRVKLEIENDDPNSDYINACYITGYGNVKNKYIASQGPNDVNIKEFIRMLWDVNISRIAMLTKEEEFGTVKSMKYWPNKEGIKTFGKLTVKTVDEDVLAHFTIRTLKLTKLGQDTSRIITHYQYTSWPDKGVPGDVASLVEYRNKIRKARNQTGPMVAHCSAGIGRTGTFLALDYLLEEAEAEGSVDVFECVKQMRNERVNMVQTLDQFVFIHEAILDWFVAGRNTSSISDYPKVYKNLLRINKITGESELRGKFEMMNSMRPEFSEDDFIVALYRTNKSKNRFDTILPYDRVRPILVDQTQGGTDYINAVYLPGYRKKQSYILTQTPLPNTVVDFWKLVVQSESHAIIYMDHGQKQTEDIGLYIPETSMTCGSFTITNTAQNQHDSYTEVTCKITKQTDKTTSQIVRIYLCSFWKGNDKIPKSPAPIFDLLENVQSWNKQQGDNSVVVHCRNGVDKSGLFCVLAAILERLTVEQDVSVLQTILQLRASRPQIITCYEQLKFCFEAVGNYLDNFSTYANSC